jgi:hypothetical protein
MSIEELDQKINNLSEVVNIMDDTVKFHINTMWTVLAFVAAVVGASLFFLIKTWIQKRIDLEVERNKQRIEKEFEIIRDNFVLKSEDWTRSILVNGWISDPNQPVKYAKDLLGFINISGIALNGVVSDGIDIFRLPAGYRPSSIITFQVICGEERDRHVAELTLDSDGKLKIYGCTRNRVILNGIRFSAEK